MSASPDGQSWFGPNLQDASTELADNPQEFERLWRGFMTARVTLGLVLLLLQTTLYALSASKGSLLILFCLAYFTATLAGRLMTSPTQLGKKFTFQWVSTFGVDVLTFAALQVAQGSSINYAPLFALPVLMASVLGSLVIAMGAAAGVTILLFAYAAWMSINVPADTASNFLQAALTGAGSFVISFLANQIATRQANVELRAERNQLAARVQKLVNELVIESLSDGVLVVDRKGTVRAANPAARRLLGADRALQVSTFDLASLTGWHGLVDQMQLSFTRRGPQQADISIHHAGQGPRRVRVRTQLTATQDSGTESLCVMFLQDQREIEARMRTEKLASMGRMSAAVAHEIRNPLAAIAQANALLDEDLTDPRQKQLTQMVGQNAKRLEKIVSDILNVARAQHQDNNEPSGPLDLNAAVLRICRDWQGQALADRSHLIGIQLSPRPIQVQFDGEHLRRILVNLLDNAKRYASGQQDAIQVCVAPSNTGQATLSVWSDGQPMDQSVERHLFEPFFSSESRSSGLGLYICRELCEGHDASISYVRTPRDMRGKSIDGNDFIVSFQPTARQGNAPITGDRRAPTPWLPSHP